MTKAKENARDIIYAQEALLSVKRSAWALYQHELDQLNPLTHRRYTSRQALRNVLRWMVLQKKRGAMAQIILTPTQKKVLDLLVLEGLTSKEIALRLDCAPVTVQFGCESVRGQGPNLEGRVLFCGEIGLFR